MKNRYKHILPLQTKVFDLKAWPAPMDFEEWGHPPRDSMNYVVYCFVIDERNQLSNQTKIEALLTDQVLFSASLLGPIGPGSGMGGGVCTLESGSGLGKSHQGRMLVGL